MNEKSRFSSCHFTQSYIIFSCDSLYLKATTHVSLGTWMDSSYLDIYVLFLHCKNLKKKALAKYYLKKEAPYFCVAIYIRDIFLYYLNIHRHLWILTKWYFYLFSTYSERRGMGLYTIAGNSIWTWRNPGGLGPLHSTQSGHFP